MKKLIFLLTVIGMIVAMESCSSGKSALTAVSLNGEWNIVEAEGRTVLANAEKGLPFIGFDAHTNRVFGDAGCNRIMGTYAVDPLKPGVLKLGPLGATMMACPDLEQEGRVLKALNSAAFFNISKNGQEAELKNAAGKTVVILKKR